jgi:hypothetical protein
VIAFECGAVTLELFEKRAESNVNHRLDQRFLDRGHVLDFVELERLVADVHPETLEVRGRLIVPRDTDCDLQATEELVTACGSISGQLDVGDRAQEECAEKNGPEVAPEVARDGEQQDRESPGPLGGVIGGVWCGTARGGWRHAVVPLRVHRALVVGVCAHVRPLA